MADGVTFDVVDLSVGTTGQGSTPTVTVSVVDPNSLLEIVPGDNITVDNTDPRRPVVSSAGGGAGGIGTVTSVEGVAPDQFGNVDLNLGTAASHATGDFDGAGAAAAAQNAAQSYTDSKVAAEVTRANSAYATTAQGAKADTAVQPGALSTVATTGAYTDLSGKPTLGTAAAKDVAATGDATSAQVVLGTDSRLTNSRTPSAHTHTEADVTGLTADLAGKVPTTRTVNGKALSADVTLTNTDVGAAATSHTHAEADITGLAADLAAKAPLASPALTGTPTAPTATAGTNTTQVATTAFVATAVAAGGGGGGSSVRSIDNPADPTWGTASTYDVEFDTDGTTLPTGWSWVNQGTSTWAQQYGSGVLTPQGQNSDSNRLIVRALPTGTTWVATAKVIQTSTQVANNPNTWYRAGMVLRESSSGKFSYVGFSSGSTWDPDSFTCSDWNSPTAFGGNETHLDRTLMQYVRITKNASGYDLAGSRDGIGWVTIATAKAFGVYDQIGLMAQAPNNTSPASFHWFRVR